VIQDLTTRSSIGVGKPKRGVYYLQQTTTERVQANKVITYNTWHWRFGHPSSQALSYIFSNIRSRNKSDLCDVCLRAKQTRMPFSISENKANNCFDLVHCDIWGPYRIKSLCGAQYFLTIVDDASRGIWIYLLKDKSEASQYLKEFYIMTNI